MRAKQVGLLYKKIDSSQVKSSHRLRNATVKTGFHETKTRAQK